MAAACRPSRQSCDGMGRAAAVASMGERPAAGVLSEGVIVEAEAVGEEADTDEWWAKVETNLRLGRLRLVFVADVISRELRRIIEFLNEQMTETEVIGVEIRQYVDASGEHQTVVPRLIGQTEAARDIKRTQSGPKRKWDRDSWLAALSARKPEAVPIAR